jgi:hypothetical protein
MIREQKYVIMEHEGVEKVLTFPRHQEHAATAHQHPGTPVAAGFFTLELMSDSSIECDAYGESYSLNGLKSREGDGELILKHMGMV